MPAAKKTSNGFVISNTIKTAWSIFKKEWITVYALILFPMVTAFGYTFLVGGFESQTSSESFNFWLYLAYMFIQFVIGMGVTKGLLQVSRGKKVGIETFTSMTPHIFNYLAAQILMMLIIIGGFLLLIIPGVYFSMKYMFTPYLVIDKGLGPIEALKASGELTKGVKWDIIGFMGATVNTYVFWSYSFSRWVIGFNSCIDTFLCCFLQ